MIGNPGDPQRSDRSVRERLSYALPGILLAVNLVLVGVIVARPWERAMVGPMRQVLPADPALHDLTSEPVVLNFWATWCIYCVSEMPSLQRLANTYDDALVIVGINVGESAATVKTFAERLGIKYHLLLDSTIDVAAAYEVVAMPTSLVVDSNGVIRAVYYGPVTPDELIAAISPLLVPVERPD